ncbi:MAG: 6,7-dimethyl-8-ribityllumazine synthase [Candidatus Cloacimonadota bacterium]|nr:MAG: 6,7-dimethyl-8-ribityllumazine synthase [Candidatus Cloacimonadota bacterium]
MNIIDGMMNGSGFKIAVIVTRFNGFITESLLDGCMDALKRHGVSLEDVKVIRIPGAFEMPVVLQKVAMSKKYDGAICLGAVIKGETPHFDFVASENAKGMQKVMLDHNFVVTNGVITTNNLEQAIERAGVKAGNKGAESALALIETLDVMKQI